MHVLQKKIFEITKTSSHLIEETITTFEKGAKKCCNAVLTRYAWKQIGAYLSGTCQKKHGVFRTQPGVPWYAGTPLYCTLYGQGYGLGKYGFQGT